MSRQANKLDYMNINVVKIILILLFIICLVDMPYGYFQLVRILGMIGFGIISYNCFRKNTSWFIVWTSSAILINPFIKITLGRGIWNIVDVIWVGLLIYSFFDSKNNVE